MNGRRLALMQILDSRKKYTARELAERFGVSLRTIQRDLDYLQSIGMPLYTEVGAGGGYRALPNRLMPPLQLNQSEALGLFMLLRLLEVIPDFPYGEIRSHLADHYYGSLPPDTKEQIDRIGDHLAFIHRGAEIPAPYTTLILKAAMEKRQLSFDYSTSGGMKITQAFPLGLYYEQGFWYVPAWRGERTLLYRADRMHNACKLDATLPELPTLKAWMKQEDLRERVQVSLAFTPFGARLAQSDPDFEGMADDRWEGRIPLQELPFFARKLLRFGPEARVLQPPTLRSLVAGLFCQAAEQYASDEDDKP
ncbi:helix-turn-helix transcriptional regulator [Paenibacillus xanthanilyticus]|uniref:Helix-turn-helix transcriptional regulator n=1 Tax=Paenibacillus xanthanilyticus TaxID=1783531 RepID=A0ABV8K7D6_9BACL